MHSQLRRAAIAKSQSIPLIFTQQIAIEKVRNFAQELLAQGLQLRQVVLFGSYAKNNQREGSDIDVVLVADEFEGLNILDRKYYKSVQLNPEYMLFQIQTYQTDYFEKGDAFIDEIKQTGIRIL